MSASEKLHKVLATAGIASRREAERWIAQGRVRVNGSVAQTGQRVVLEDKITVDGKALERTGAGDLPQILLYHKPTGEVSTRHDPEGRPTVFDNLPKPKQGRWVSIGRLDKQTSGLLVFTTSGELANYFMHPRNQILRRYSVRIWGNPPAPVLKRLTEGVELEDGQAAFESLTPRGNKQTGRNQWFEVTLREGRNREVRRLWESQGYQVNRLAREQYGPFSLRADLEVGKCRYVSDKMVQKILDQASAPELRPDASGTEDN